jgi:2-polyprenyl-6-methoxyphenol hydroxylase-like FAD-dependent oxidoreductase
VHEQAPGFERVGGAVGIQGNGLAVLDAIGVLEGFRPRIELLTRASVEAPPGRRISVADFNELSLPYIGFAVAQRYDLQETLLAAARDAGAAIRFNARCVRATRIDGGVTLGFADGEERTAEIVLACDGIRSPVRETFGFVSRKHVVNEAYLRIVAPMRMDDPSRVGEFWAPDSRRAGCFPLPGNRTYVFCSVPLGKWQDILAHSLPAWVASWRDFGAPIASLMESVTDWHSAVYDELTDLRVERWYRDRVFLLGDAAHAMTPNLGQGANSAMTDALVLVNLLSEHRDDPASAGARYEEIRKPFVTRIQRTALFGGAIASWTSPLARLARDSFFRFGSSIGPVRRSSMQLTAGYNRAEQSLLRSP